MATYSVITFDTIDNIGNIKSGTVFTIGGVLMYATCDMNYYLSVAEFMANKDFKHLEDDVAAKNSYFADSLNESGWAIYLTPEIVEETGGNIDAIQSGEQPIREFTIPMYEFSKSVVDAFIHKLDFRIPPAVKNMILSHFYTIGIEETTELVHFQEMNDLPPELFYPREAVELARKYSQYYLDRAVENQGFGFCEYLESTYDPNFPMNDEDEEDRVITIYSNNDRNMDICFLSPTDQQISNRMDLQKYIADNHFSNNLEYGDVTIDGQDIVYYKYLGEIKIYNLLSKEKETIKTWELTFKLGNEQ